MVQRESLGNVVKERRERTDESAAMTDAKNFLITEAVASNQLVHEF